MGNQQQALAKYEPQAVVAAGNTFLPELTIDLAVQRRDAIVQFTKRIMVESQDFGTIPGTDKPTLLKPGAEKLCSFFGLEPEYITVDQVNDWMGTEHGGEPFFYIRYQCRLHKNGKTLGCGEGSASSWESKYRYRWVPREQVPSYLDVAKLVSRGGTVSEFAFAINKAETGGKYGKPTAYWEQWKLAIQRGEARKVIRTSSAGKPLDAWEMDRTVYRIPNPDVADIVNTLQKMAQKRALVAATLVATSASEFYTQDTEDLPQEGAPPTPQAPPQNPPEPQSPHPSEPPQAPPAAAKPAAKTRPLVTREDFTKMRQAFEEKGPEAIAAYDEIVVQFGGTPGGVPKMASKAMECIKVLQEKLNEFTVVDVKAESEISDEDLPPEMWPEGRE